MKLARTLAVCAGLAVIVVIAFWPALSCGFTNYDDDDYVTRNPWVRQGLSSAGWSWAWTTTHSANWHPLTWLSHMLDWELFGDDPAGHHAVGLSIHVVNTLLLFSLLLYATGSTGRSAVAAALFGVHPLHVESVAWIAERKDVLSTLFWLSASMAWVRYAKSGCERWRWGAVALLAAGLCAKPMLVTLPFVLLLLDRWPLGRWPVCPSSQLLWPLLREKLPMFALVAVSSLVTLLAQSAGGAVRTLEEVRLSIRLANVPVAYGAYLLKTLWPVDLAVLYPHRPHGPPVSSILVSLAVLVLLSWLALRQRTRRPYLLVGWLWFLGTLVPVIGLLQVGPQAMADRYTYVPSIGLFVAASWLCHDLLAAKSCRDRGRRTAGSAPVRVAAAAGALMLVIVLVLATRVQVSYWKDSVALFTRALSISGSHPLIHNNLGVALFDAGKLTEAIAQYRDALREGPFYEAHVNLGSALLLQGSPVEAADQLQQALALRPDHPDALNDLGLALTALGRTGEAIERYRVALTKAPGRARTHANLGAALVAAGRPEEAVVHCREAVRLDPHSAEAHLRLALALSSAGHAAEAAESYRQSLNIDPRQPRALNNLGAILIELAGPDQALELFDRAIRLAPDYGEAYSNRAAALYLNGACAEALRALRLAREYGFEPPQQLTAALSGPCAGMPPTGPR